MGLMEMRTGRYTSLWRTPLNIQLTIGQQSVGHRWSAGRTVMEKEWTEGGGILGEACTCSVSQYFLVTCQMMNF